jgi:formylglycine-generating enzyme required for sulfatase activity
MHGNVYERVRDCWTPDYIDAPPDGSAWLTGDCRALGLRGGAWISSPELIRSGERDAYNGYYRSTVMGFRVVRELR